MILVVLRKTASITGNRILSKLKVLQRIKILAELEVLQRLEISSILRTTIETQAYVSVHAFLQKSSDEDISV